MSPKKTSISYTLVFLLLLTVQSCYKYPCAEAVCSPCPSNHFVMQFEDADGQCPVLFHKNAKVIGFYGVAQVDTAFKYSLADSCQASILVDKEYNYLITSGNKNYHVTIDHFTIQTPIEIDECCLCYPIDSLQVTVNDSVYHVKYPSTEYVNTPMKFEI